MKISIVIATYNRLLELGELLESISKQTVLPHEVIIVNDGGESVAVLVDLYKELPIKAIELTENVKHVKARNIGVQQATGDAIMLCDDDDMIVANHIEQAQLYLREADFIYFDAEIVAFEIQDQTRYPLSRRTFAYQYDIEEMRKFSTYIPSGSVYKRNVHEKIGLFDSEVHNYWDWDFILRAAKVCNIQRVPTASVIYAFSENGNNQSAELNERRKLYLDKLCEKHDLGDLPTKNFFVLLEEPYMKQREAQTNIVWDGKPFVSRLANLEVNDVTPSH
ncbi:glycosyltransferase family 2 protein [Metabacillus litoralis]|uniref:Glycosyltransferase family 2 protein n=1 Tax=Metabacillus litoralis TaxID=152268 RepID=A0A5C6VV88_9BACI|nr:glycosyltransferase family 2 protein [Metabacillus litoralis]TXC89452.1 glycosyltransferase family 2 protein [Metabacillus litoralis]